MIQQIDSFIQILVFYSKYIRNTLNITITIKNIKKIYTSIIRLFTFYFQKTGQINYVKS